MIVKVKDKQYLFIQQGVKAYCQRVERNYKIKNLSAVLIIIFILLQMDKREH